MGKMMKIKGKPLGDVFDSGVCYPGNNDSNDLILMNKSPKVSGNLKLTRKNECQEPTLRRVDMAAGSYMTIGVQDRFGKDEY